MAPAANRRERERKRHREEILEAAEAVFAEKGFHRTTVEDVAARAEFSVGTLYNFFSSKEELFTSLIEKRIEQLSTTVTEVLEEVKAPEEAVRVLLRSRINHAFRHQGIISLDLLEYLHDHPLKMRQKMGALREQIQNRLIEFFREGMASGEFRSDLDPFDMTIALESLSHGFLFEWLTNPKRVDLRDKYEVIIRLFFDGVRKR